MSSEAQADKIAATQDSVGLVQKWKDGVRKTADGTAIVWYWGHFWGRAQIWCMTLHFASVEYEFVGFTNDLYDAMKPQLNQHGLREVVNGPLPCIQIDGIQIADTLAACRYIAQSRGGLYPAADPKDIVRIECLLTGAQSLFQTLVNHHYRKYNTKGGAKQPSDEEDRAAHGAKLASQVAKRNMPLSLTTTAVHI